MQNAIILHGTGGHPTENWFPWLKSQLENKGIKTFVPQLSEPENPNRNVWLTEASSFETGPDTILIGHSLGGVLALRMLESGHKAKAVYLVAPPITDLGREVLKESLFFADSFDWQMIKKQCSHFEIFASINDPHVPLSEVEKIAEGLGIKVQVLDVYKHFNMQEFPYLLERIETLNQP